MTKAQSNKLNMYDAVGAFLTEFAAKFTGYVALIALKTEFISLVAEIKIKEAEVKTAPAGKTSAKYEAKDVLITALLPLVKKLFVLAKKNGNEEIKAICTMSRSDFNKMRDTDLEIKAEMISNYLDANKTELANYMVTDEIITAMKSKIAAFKGAQDLQDSGMTSKVAGHGTLNQLFERADELLHDEMDGLMEHYAETERVLYDSYRAARVLKDLGYHQPAKTEETEPVHG
jgi:hypothetical protein